MSWIKCSDCLPEKDIKVLFSNGEEIFLGWMLTDMGKEIFWSHYDYLEEENITHWMPLPEPPKDL